MKFALNIKYYQPKKVSFTKRKNLYNQDKIKVDIQ